MDKSGIFSKWVINGIDGYVFGSDKELYRLPFRAGRNHFGLRRLKMQYPNRWKINGEWYSKRQLWSRITLNPKPKILIIESETPF